jgi:hypothetical protein
MGNGAREGRYASQRHEPALRLRGSFVLRFIMAREE